MSPLASLAGWIDAVPWLHDAARPLAGTLLEASLRSTVLLALGLAAGALPGIPAARRHLALALALIGCLALPPAATVMPGWTAASLPDPAVWNLPPSFVHPAPAGPVAAGADIAAAAALPAAPRPAPWTTWLVLVWAAGALCVAARIVAGMIGAQALVSRARPVDSGPLADALTDGLYATGASPRTRLRIGHAGASPFTWGLVRPTVVLPRDAAGWPGGRQRAVLLHELVHIRRRDPLTGLCALGAAVLLWWHPLVWLALRRLGLEAERACDDGVLCSGIAASEYAGDLIGVARHVRRARRCAASPSLSGGRRALRTRVLSIVDPGRQRAGLDTARVFPAGLLVLCLVVAPLAGARVFARDDGATGGVTGAELAAVEDVLGEFADALRRGDDFETTRARFLTEDYFAVADRTLENLPRAEQRRILDNSIDVLLRSAPWRVAFGREVLGLEKDGDRYLLTQRLNLSAVGRDGGRIELVQDDLQTVELVARDGRLLIDGIDGALGVGRMDVDNPYGPIFIVTVAEAGTVTPSGPLLFKSFPARYGKGGLTTLETTIDDLSD
jgi:beta-lactamase regulating signal transducer with metallopeptidase domain